AGLLQCVFNRTQSKAETVAAELKTIIADSPSVLAKQCELIIICVSKDEDVLEMIGEIKSNLSTDAIIIDTSTVSAATAKRAAEQVNEAGGHFLDCPVSGGVEGAKNGTLAMMVGGEESVLEQARETLSAIAANVMYIGPNGAGQATKAVNQIMAAGINQAVTEALAFGKAMDLPMDKVVDIVSSGAAGNWFVQHRGKTMLGDSYEPGFKLALHHKDLTICKSMIQKLGENLLPTVEMTLIHYEKLMQQGYGEEDISALFRLKQQLFETS
ncbi:MAG: NAD(P)-dependent oxidoreductase, partial [Pseudomonadota bacterium]